MNTNLQNHKASQVTANNHNTITTSRSLLAVTLQDYTSSAAQLEILNQSPWE
jgi:cell division septal protein FtsQ